VRPLKNPKKMKISFVFKQKTKGKIYKTDFFNGPTVAYFEETIANGAVEKPPFLSSLVS